jgi:hypothetical protein
MPNRSNITSSFTRVALSEKDTISGTILSTMHAGVIQNHICDIAEQKLNLVFDPTNMIDFAQQNAYLQGQLDILKLLLDSSEASHELALQQAAAQSQ